MNQLLLEKIKKSNGRVRIVESNSEYLLQIICNNSWQTVYTSRDKSVCEQIISKANGKIILG